MIGNVDRLSDMGWGTIDLADIEKLRKLFCHQLEKMLKADAIDAVALTPQPVITIQTAMLGSDRVRITIEDNDCGIPAGIQSRLFDPFFTTKPVGQGNGMGLAVSYQIITVNHKGELYFRPTPAAGNRFIVELPITIASSSQ